MSALVLIPALGCQGSEGDIAGTEAEVHAVDQQLDCGEWLDAPRTITRYAITYSNGSITTREPKDWTFEGWNGSAWVVLDTRPGQTSWLGTERREYSVTTPGAYGKYRVNITDDNDTRTAIETISMGRLEFLGCK
ncbi:hypothetical protein JQX13_36970 [Archangium violaceum]|uniref:hypothetical protein n=1 Tax=Archangium violaceum TaxID=83451 RepID=UPI00193C289B|nr:hypothetical protein [Archangium violaceum]QRK05700.1 hypothetical protein JQX13_36970 [Archangium violaceum]